MVHLALLLIWNYTLSYSRVVSGAERKEGWIPNGPLSLLNVYVPNDVSS